MSRRNGAILFALMFISYAVLTLNTVAIADHNRAVLFITDLSISTLNFTILKRIIEAGTVFEMVCYALGGAIGAQVALFILH